jgi:hypothetical protein
MVTRCRQCCAVVWLSRKFVPRVKPHRPLVRSCLLVDGRKFELIKLKLCNSARGKRFNDTLRRSVTQFNPVDLLFTEEPAAPVVRSARFDLFTSSNGTGRSLRSNSSAIFERQGRGDRKWMQFSMLRLHSPTRYPDTLAVIEVTGCPPSCELACKLTANGLDTGRKVEGIWFRRLFRF